MNMQINAGLRFWLAWILAHVVALAGVLPATIYLAVVCALSIFIKAECDIANSSFNTAAISSFLFAFFSMLGAAQWVVLRRRVPISAWWIPVTGIFFTAYIYMVLLLGGWLGGILGLVAGVYIAFTVGALVPGIAQWLILRRCVPRAGWWIIAVPAGAFAVFGVLFDRRTFVQVVSAMATYGAVTGFVLVWLIRSRELDDAVPLTGVTSGEGNTLEAPVTKRAAIYARVSTDGQRHKYSIPTPLNRAGIT